MVDFFLTSADEQRARNAQHLDDIDLVESKERRGHWGGLIVAVAQRNGVHVCWQCGEAFVGTDRHLRPTEVQCGEALIMLHAKCINPKVRSFRSLADITRGLQARKFYAKATEKLSSILSSE